MAVEQDGKLRFDLALAPLRNTWVSGRSRRITPSGEVEASKRLRDASPESLRRQQLSRLVHFSPSHRLRLRGLDK
jgi:hypothetical protein